MIATPPVYADAIDIAATFDPDAAACPGCQHFWPLADMCRDRNGDNICPDCLYTWSAYPDNR